MPQIKLGDDMYENKNQEEQEKNIIDKDLYENFSEEELLTYFEEARQQSEEKERNKKKKKSIFSRWIVWVIALAMLFQVIAILPETFSIPAVKFLKTSATLSTQQDIQAYKKAVVLIETAEGKGTGFAFESDGKILTNEHVVEGFDKVNIVFRDDGLFVGKVTKTYPDIDLAVVEIEEDVTVPALDLANDFELRPEQNVYFIGNPLNFTGIANEGEVLDYVNVESKDKPVVMMDAPVYRGNSGSPVINKDGEVIGVVFATLFHDEAGRVGLFIPINYFYDVNID